MTENQNVIDSLNSLLTGEFTAINQYFLQSELCKAWGLKNLYKTIKKQKKDEILHASWLIQRIAFLKGEPNISDLKPVRISKHFHDIIEYNKGTILIDTCAYQEAISIVSEAKDFFTVDLLNAILKVKNNHLHWHETQYHQIEKMGIDNYLTNQVGIAPCWF